MKDTGSSHIPHNVVILTWLLAACSMIGPFATDMYLPSFHEMTEVFGVPLSGVQQTLSAYLVGFAVMTLFYGTVSDVIGRKPTMVGGFLGFALASLGAAFSSALEMVIVFRFIQGVFAGCGAVVGMAVIRDLYGGPEAQKLMAYVSMVFGFGPALAPVIGGWIATHLGWQSHFFVLAGISFFLAVSCLVWLPESLPKSKRLPVSFTGLMSEYAHTMCHAGFMTGCLALGIAFLGQGVFIAGAADWCVNVMHFSPNDFWMLFLPMIGGVVIGSWIAARSAQRLGTVMTIRLAFVVMMAGAALDLIEILCVSQPVMPMAVAGLIVYTTGLGMMRPGMSLLLMDTFPNSRGMASSVLNFIQTILFALCSSVIVPMLYGSFVAYDWGLIASGVLTIPLWLLSTRLHLRSDRRAQLRDRSRKVE